MPPSIITSPTDHRHRVHDGDKIVAIYEPHESADAEAHLAQLQPKARRRAAPAAREGFALELTAAPVSRASAATPAAADVDRVHLQKFSDGYRVWHPGRQLYVAGSDGAYRTQLEAQDRAREIMVSMAQERAPSARVKAHRAAAPQGGGLFGASAPQRGEQVGFKFNGRPAPRPPVFDEYAIGRPITAHEARQSARPRRSAVEEYEAQAALKPNAAPVDAEMAQILAALAKLRADNELQVVQRQTRRERVRGVEIRRFFVLLRRGDALAWLEVTHDGGIMGFVEYPGGAAVNTPTAFPRAAVVEALRARGAKRNGATVHKVQVVQAKTTRQRVRGVEFRRRFFLLRAGQQTVWVEVSEHGAVLGFVDRPGGDPIAAPNHYAREGVAAALRDYAARHGGSLW
jgi:hypothetical protein